MEHTSERLTGLSAPGALAAISRNLERTAVQEASAVEKRFAHIKEKASLLARPYVKGSRLF